jgi:hypothetical protein
MLREVMNQIYKDWIITAAGIVEIRVLNLSELLSYF